MMTRGILFSILLCGLIMPLTAQIKGIVIDSDNQPVEFANVAIYSLPDTTLLSGTMTDKLGSFTLSIENSANKLLRVSFIGYETQTLPAEPELQIMLKSDTTMLSELVVNGNLPQIRLRDDAVVATVQNTVLSKAGTGNDVLKRLPAITGDDGDFTVFGKGKAKIYINNREMRDPSELDLISSSDIKEVEIIHNPGAKYDASVKAIIRIHTMRKVGDGFSFDVRSTYYQSYSVDLRQQLNLNYRYRGWDLFATVSHNRSAYFQDSDMTQTVYVDTLWTQDNLLYVDGLNNQLTTVAGINYEINSKHYLGTKYMMTTNPGKNRESIRTISDVFANNNYFDNWESKSVQHFQYDPQNRINFYYNGNFGDLKVDLNSDFYKGSNSSKTNVTEISKEFENRNIQSTNYIENRFFATKLVLTYPLLGGQLTAGNEFTRTRRIDNYQTDMELIPTTNTSIHDYNNSIFAEYARATPIGRFSAGVRYENVYFDYFNDDIKIEEQSKKYNHWFPNISYSNTLGSMQFQLSYNVKTIRPSYWQLGSNTLYGNRFTLQTGNPFLRPSIIHDASLSGAWKFFQLMASYKKEKDIIIQWAEQLEDNPAVTLLSTKNIDEIPSLTLFLTATPKFGIWTPQASVGFIKQWLTLNSINKEITLNNLLPIASLNNSFSFSNNLLVTFDANFQGKGSSQNVELLRNKYILNLGVTKSFFNERLSITLKGYDLLYENKNNILLYNNKMLIHQLSKFDTRELEMTVRYKFNTNGSRYKGTGAGESEFNRL